MELTPQQKIIQIGEVRAAMIKSAGCHEAIAPATKVDINAFYNSCIGCMAAVKQLQNAKEATITGTLWTEIHNLINCVELLREEVVKHDPRYQQDGPLVKCLSRLMNKGDTVLREVRSQCNIKMLDAFGEDWMNETNERFAKDLQIVIKDMSPCVAYSTATANERTKNRTAPMSTGGTVGGGAANTTANSTNAADHWKYNASGATDAQAAYKDGSGSKTYSYMDAPPSIAGALDDEKHVTFISPHPDNERPEKVGVASIPHFKGPNYINLPQFTGVPEHSLPIFQQEMPPMHKTPNAENVYMAPKYPAP